MVSRRRLQKNDRFVIGKTPTKAAVVALRITPDITGITGGGLIPDPGHD